ncbi:ACP S-malonyltransferase [Streptomyces sp. SAJ15]|uniref:ACP S-malonyltransferase n=1 Tax=Streptomyces sp. SAJ15 TaxID=2011095 RepID=UPI0011854BB5|nr:ACP S-malonyltransferase [Streptomyces sp. SAJ15]TVL89240.1 ACP S-malonyltransferase [Streptomyces sp. SAJ15]
MTTAVRDETRDGRAGGPRTALVFPGQGAQKQGMGAVWRDSAAWPVVAEISEYIGMDVEDLILRADDATLRRTDLAQIAVFTTEVLAYREAAAAGVLGRVVACAGHSLGEYTALHAAGVLSLADTARLIAARGRAMREAAETAPGTMAAIVKLTTPVVEELTEAARATGQRVWVANVNAPGAVVVSGTVEGVEALEEPAREAGGKLIRIAVGGAFHSPLMAPAADALGIALETADFAPGTVPVVANVDARPHPGSEAWRERELRQLTSPVRWEESVRTLAEELDCPRFVELGPGRQLIGMIRRIATDAERVAVDKPEVLTAI